MAYSSKAAIFEIVCDDQYDIIPIILDGNLNIDLRSSNGRQFRSFVRGTFNLKLNDDSAIS